MTMNKKRKVKAVIVGKGDYAAPRPRKTDKNPSAKKEDKYAGWEETFRRDRYGNRSGIEAEWKVVWL